MPRLTAMRGYPAAGKTSLARTLTGVVVGRDFLRYQMFGEYVLDADGEDAVTIAQRAMIRDLLKAGRDVVIDDCNLNPKYLRAFARIASRHGASFEVVDVRTPPEECKRRDHARMTEGGRYVSDAVIDKMAKRWPMDKWPTIAADPPLIVEPAPAWGSRLWAVVYDLDGSAAIHNGRSPYDFSRVSEDLPNESLRFVLEAFCHAPVPIEFIACSGRDDTCREDTANWLLEHGFPFDMLLMRDTDNDRDERGNKLADMYVKYRLYNEYIRGKFDVVAVFDDRLQVCAGVWHKLGLPLYRVGDPEAEF